MAAMRLLSVLQCNFLEAIRWFRINEEKHIGAIVATDFLCRSDVRIPPKQVAGYLQLEILEEQKEGKNIKQLVFMKMNYSNRWSQIKQP